MSEVALNTRATLDWAAAAAFALAAVALVTLAGLYRPEVPLIAVGAVSAALLLIMWRRPWWFVVGLVVWMPFETVILKMLPLRGPTLFLMQFAAEAATYLALAMLVGRRLLHGQGFRRTPLDLPLLVFVVVALVSVVANQAAPVPAAMNLRSLLRYAAVFYLVSQLKLSPAQVRRLIVLVLVIGGAQILAGVAQAVGGTPVKQAMLPPMVAGVEGASRGFILLERGRELGSLFGTLGDTIYFGLFLLIVLMLLLTRPDRKWSLGSGLFAAALLTGIAYSYSRAALVAAAFVLVVYVGWRHGWRVLTGSAATAIALLVAVLLVGVMVQDQYRHPRRSEQSVVENMTGFLSPEYLQRAKKQRLGAVLGIGPTSLANAPLIGYGPDELHTIDRLNAARPSWLFKRLDKGGFEDVYWVAMLSYYGLLGVAAYAWLLGRMAWVGAALSRTARDPVTRWTGGATLLISLATAFLMWFMRVPEFRIHGFYLWLLPALMTAMAAWELREESSATAAEVRS